MRGSSVSSPSALELLEQDALDLHIRAVHPNSRASHPTALCCLAHMEKAAGGFTAFACESSRRLGALVLRILVAGAGATYLHRLLRLPDRGGGLLPGWLAPELRGRLLSLACQAVVKDSLDVLRRFFRGDCCRRVGIFMKLLQRALVGGLQSGCRTFELAYQLLLAVRYQRNLSSVGSFLI